MKPLRLSLPALAAVAALSFTLPSTPAHAEKIVALGTAGVTGVYYPAGGAICRLVNRNRKEHGIRCAVESTGGSINNLESIQSGEMELGVVQSDLLYDAYNATGVFASEKPNTHLRALFSLHPEPFTVVARKDSKIETLDDLKGKRVNLGAAGSGMRATMEELMQRKGWNYKTFGAVVDLKQNDQAQALCSGKVDAIVYAGGHPNGAIQQITTLCPARLVNVTGEVIDQLIKDRPFYAYATIPGGMYQGNPQETKTFGVKAVLVASDELEAQVAYEVTRAVFSNLDNFRTLHPVFANLSAEHMARDAADIVPFHEGALRYLREKGLVK